MRGRLTQLGTGPCTLRWVPQGRDLPPLAPPILKPLIPRAGHKGRKDNPSDRKDDASWGIVDLELDTRRTTGSNHQSTLLFS